MTTRPAQRAAVPGLRPFRESLATGAGLVRQPLVAPLGFALLGLTSECLAQDFARAPPTRFADDNLTADVRWRLGVSIGPRLAPTAWSGVMPERTRRPFQGSRTGTLPHIRARPRPG
jgi:hypothetical protein